PLSEMEVIKVFLTDRPLLILVGDYSLSLKARDYDYLGHPLYFDYARGRMADPRTPAYLRNDPELRRECLSEKQLAGPDERGRGRPLPDRASKLIETIRL